MADAAAGAHEVRTGHSGVFTAVVQAKAISLNGSGPLLHVNAGVDEHGWANLRLRALWPGGEFQIALDGDWGRSTVSGDVEIIARQEYAGALAEALRFAADAMEAGAAKAKGELVYSKLRMLAHDPRCTWAERILPENRQAGTREEALAACERPCRVCRPAAETERLAV